MKDTTGKAVYCTFDETLTVFHVKQLKDNKVHDSKQSSGMCQMTGHG